MPASRSKRRSASAPKRPRTRSKPQTSPPEPQPRREAAPQITPAYQKRIRRLRENIHALEVQNADLDLRKQDLLTQLRSSRHALQQQVHAALEGAGIDFHDGPQGIYSIDFETMRVTFESESSDSDANGSS